MKNAELCGLSELNPLFTCFEATPKNIFIAIIITIIIVGIIFYIIEKSNQYLIRKGFRGLE